MNGSATTGFRVSAYLSTEQRSWNVWWTLACWIIWTRRIYVVSSKWLTVFIVLVFSMEFHVSSGSTTIAMHSRRGERPRRTLLPKCWFGVTRESFDGSTVLDWRWALVQKLLISNLQVKFNGFMLFKGIRKQLAWIWRTWCTNSFRREFWRQFNGFGAANSHSKRTSKFLRPRINEHLTWHESLSQGRQTLEMEFNNLLQIATERRPENEHLSKSWSSLASSLSDE